MPYDIDVTTPAGAILSGLLIASDYKREQADRQAAEAIRRSEEMWKQKEFGLKQEDQRLKRQEATAQANYRYDRLNLQEQELERKKKAQDALEKYRQQEYDRKKRQFDLMTDENRKRLILQETQKRIAVGGLDESDAFIHTMNLYSGIGEGLSPTSGQQLPPGQVPVPQGRDINFSPNLSQRSTPFDIAEKHDYYQEPDPMQGARMAEMAAKEADLKAATAIRLQMKEERAALFDYKKEFARLRNIAAEVGIELNEKRIEELDILNAALPDILNVRRTKDIETTKNIQANRQKTQQEIEIVSDAIAMARRGGGNGLLYADAQGRLHIRPDKAGAKDLTDKAIKAVESAAIEVRLTAKASQEADETLRVRELVYDKLTENLYTPDAIDKVLSTPEGRKAAADYREALATAKRLKQLLTDNERAHKGAKRTLSEIQNAVKDAKNTRVDQGSIDAKNRAPSSYRNRAPDQRVPAVTTSSGTRGKTLPTITPPPTRRKPIEKMTKAEAQAYKAELLRGGKK